MSFKFFRLEEFNCTHTNLNSMDLAFIHRLDELRVDSADRIVTSRMTGPGGLLRPFRQV